MILSKLTLLKSGPEFVDVLFSLVAQVLFQIFWLHLFVMKPNLTAPPVSESSSPKPPCANICVALLARMDTGSKLSQPSLSPTNVLCVSLGSLQNKVPGTMSRLPFVPVTVELTVGSPSRIYRMLNLPFAAISALSALTRSIGTTSTCRSTSHLQKMKSTSPRPRLRSPAMDVDLGAVAAAAAPGAPGGKGAKRQAVEDGASQERGEQKHS